MPAPNHSVFYRLDALPATQPCQHPPLSFLQAGCPSCHPTNSNKALKKQVLKAHHTLSNVKAVYRVRMAGYC